MNILVLNCGSSSVKFAAIDPDTGKSITEGKIDRIGEQLDHAQALERALQSVNGLEIAAVGHRVVHGGQKFHDAVRIDDVVLAEIERCLPLAPLHNPANLAGIRAALAALPSVPQVAVFDTAFHARLPRRARTYAIDTELAEKHGIRRYGFHGTSHAFVTKRAAAHLGRPLSELRIVSLHLGNGASACAVEFGHSTETSMGMTPLEGLVMGTRAGDIDAGALLALMRGEGLDADGLDEILNQRSGLAGLSGAGNDLRDIERRAAEGDDRARLAIAVFAHRAKKYVGAYAAAMGGLDAVVLTGGIGENSAPMRQRILQRLDFLGLVLDDDRNHDARPTAEAPVAVVSGEQSRVAALVVKTNEELAIAEQVQALVTSLTRVENPGPIPIAISARHLHLTKETFAQLFGEDATPTLLKDISQPGQFACKETVSIIGPRSRIDGVRLLGPFRKQNQIEVSRTDEFVLGVDAPIRDSGHTQGSAPIVLEGPKGSVTLTEGLICAKRHIHMTPQDAERYGVKDGDEVEVAVTGGPRDLIFGDVLIRVSPKYRLEMHIDTDEANAAELSRDAEGGLVYTGVGIATGRLEQRRIPKA
jgi:acetate kinase